MTAEDKYKKFKYLIPKIVKNFLSRVPANVQAGDLFSAGSLALWEASTKYAHLDDLSFERYAWVRVRGAIVDELRQAGWYSQKKGKRVVLSLEDFEDWENLLVDIPEDPAEEITRRQLAPILFAELPSRHKWVLENYYLKRRKMKDIGEELGVTEARISLIIKSVKQRIKKILGDT